MSQSLEGVKVLELGSLIAGPFAGRLMAEFGADVIKVEPPKKGDPLREWRHIYEGTSLWWRLQSRNKKSITVDLKSNEGQEIIKSLVKECDVVIENFRPGTLEKWNLGYEELSSINPGLVMVRVSGYGQTGPYRDKPGFGSIGESMGGLRHLTGHPDLPPTRVGISLGDSLAAMYSVIGAMMAIYHRDVKGTGKGQVVDVALYEAVFSLMEGSLPEFDKLGAVRERTGSSLPGIAPSNTYQCRNGKYIVIGGNGDAIFKRLMNVIGRADLAEDERFQKNSGRADHADFLDEVIEGWTRTMDFEQALEKLDEARVPAGPIYSIEDIVKDEHYLSREMIQDYQLNEEESLKIPGVVPKMSETPGGTKWLGPELGQHTEEVMKSWLSYDGEKIQKLKEQGII
ncbi:CaiB/BaiF CoA transferase family protein [Halobacillus karajensis]|uniref:Succinyl-CoA:(R)-benzylsuccinate CoA-transferase subunit BbsF n=1 Tax=Halobacillus karajensis TaxID=195088 RepID=A0A059NWQ7_9BACI|nr:CoA transferase [Halobacillus karajensis]CDQ18960.1 Succinyl-CoA:(R)-benzylsuccinate CoA-transferase subunit BbsF [Halobacillus karajensis]CDQ22966.1 Succinyl-CoA:(R)-benzylsuccinate CoA-transferase subunit BbsF [Halobacillus karajensis]CDQ26449.1 Succinyl-CoA:(R)-benzylsuccinate CoA-transferase subunit BbsF [Halobacillus karajensis]